MKRVTSLLGLFLLLLGALSFTAAYAKAQDPQLNLSHIACADGGVIVEFVLVHVPEGTTDFGVVQYVIDGQSRTAEFSKKTGNTAHYLDFIGGPPKSSYHVESAYVKITIGARHLDITLHNPGNFSPGRDCAVPPTETPVAEKTATATKTEVVEKSPTPTPTVQKDPTATRTEVVEKSPTPTATEVGVPSDTPTPTGTLVSAQTTDTPTATETQVGPSDTPTDTPTVTETRAGPSDTPTDTPTPTRHKTKSPHETSVPAIIPTNTPGPGHHKKDKETPAPAPAEVAVTFAPLPTTAPISGAALPDEPVLMILGAILSIMGLVLRRL